MSEFVICYDITENRRLQRVHRFLTQYALPLQYSVFLFVGDERKLKALTADLIKRIHERTDDLRIYPLPQRGFRGRLGKAVLPEGIQCAILPAQM